MSVTSTATLLTQRKTATAVAPHAHSHAHAPHPLTSPTVPVPPPLWVPGVRGVPVEKAPTPGLKQYTWEEVAEHRSVDSCWVYAGRSVYDITNWLPRHPGGSDVLKLVAGRDITDLLPSYHPFALEKVEDTLQKYKIGELICSELPQFRPDSGFYRELCSEVKKYFDATGKHPKDPLPGIFRFVFILSVAAVMLYYVIGPGWTECSLSTRMVLAAICGVFQALPLLHQMHDASHTSIGKSQGWWRFFGRITLDWFAGASLTSWKHQHIVGHHVYTNVVGADPDLPINLSMDIRRVAPHQSWLSFHQFQHLYLLFLYGALSIKFRIQDVTDTIIAQTNGPIRVNLEFYSELLWMIATKGVWIVWRILLPLYVFGVPAWQYWLCFFILEWMTGWYLAFNFQVSHVSPAMAFPGVQSGASFNDEWAIAQMKTTVDYGHGSWVTAFLSGALNHQVVHHLFPCVSQYHYPALVPIITKVAKKYNVPYHILDSFSTAFYLHYLHLKNMGDLNATMSMQAMQ